MKNRVLQKMFNRYVYEHTKKPTHYVRIANPKSLQDFRQIQFNRWSKRFGVYSGSYLPDDPLTLRKKGWNEQTSPKNTTGDHRTFQRKSTGQLVRFDRKSFKKGRFEDEHYHWKNAKSDREFRKKDESEKYIDRYGNICADKSPESHLAPKDKNYHFRK